MTLKRTNLNASTELPSVPVSSAEMKRRATAWLRKRGLVLPYRRTALSKWKEFAT